MKERKVLAGLEALDFYVKATENQNKFTFEDNTYESIGGWWTTYDDEGHPEYTAYDFCSGKEVFIEEFWDKEEAIKYASGIPATPKGWSETI